MLLRQRRILSSLVLSHPRINVLVEGDLSRVERSTAHAELNLQQNLFAPPLTSYVPESAPAI